MASLIPLEADAARGLDGLEALVVEVDKLVSLPDIYYRLEEAIVDPTATTDRIAELLRSDPDLCARMLRMANSAFYSFTTTIETIERAVSTIGLRQIRELVLVTSVIKAFEGIPAGTVNMARFWEHSVGVGIMARELGRAGALPNAEGFYIPGLLHDIGHLVMYLKLPGLMAELLRQRAAGRQTLHLLERQRLEYTHAEVGGRLLEFWKVPQSIWEPVATHHEPRNGGEFALAASAVHVADAWVNTRRLDSSGLEFELRIDAQAMLRIGIECDDLDRIGALAGEQIDGVLRQFLAH